MPRLGPSSAALRLPRWLSTELGARVASAIVLALLAVLVTALGGLYFAGFWLAAGLLVLVEWIEVTRAQPRARLRWMLGLALAVCSLTVVLGAGAPSVALVLAAGFAAAIAFGRTGRDRLWAGLGLTCALVVALVPALVRDDPRLGLAGILWMFAVVWATDVAAYFTGRHLGGPKLWPSVSPKKTWSGFAGGLAAGTACGLLVGLAVLQAGGSLPLGLAAIGALSAIASAASQGGDLAESALKRRFRVKDTGRIIPGHGGVMDRLDGFFAVALLLGLALLLAELRPLGPP